MQCVSNMPASFRVAGRARNALPLRPEIGLAAVPLACCFPVAPLWHMSTALAVWEPADSDIIICRFPLLLLALDLLYSLALFCGGCAFGRLLWCPSEDSPLVLPSGLRVRIDVFGSARK